ncbi:kinase-like protein [Trichoderma gracile]
MASPDFGEETSSVGAPSPISVHSTPAELHVAQPPEAIIAQASEAPDQIPTVQAESLQSVVQGGRCNKTTASRTAERSNAFDLGTLVKSLEEESRSYPDARLVVTCPPAIDLVFDKDSAVTPLQPILGGYLAFAVAQGYEKPMFQFRLPYRQIAPEATSPSDEADWKIIYNPTNNTCTLVHSVTLEHGEAILLTNMDDPPARVYVPHGRPCVLSKGFWRASATVSGMDDVSEYDLTYILVLDRKFNVHIFPGPDFGTRKRRAPSTIEDQERSLKRQKIHHSPRFGIDIRVNPIQSLSNANKCKQTVTSRRIMSKALTTILDLEDGYVASISGSVKGGLEPYELRQRWKCPSNKYASMSISRHSSMPEDIVVKVFLHDHHGSDLRQVIRAWTREKTILQLVIHKHIVKLKGFDARMLTIYYGILPPSLARGTWSSLQAHDAEKVLRQISSALAYLAAENIVHNDVQPANIAYSGDGAVLFNFELASLSGAKVDDSSPWYPPPESRQKDICSPAADVWALGITMLYLLGKMPLPGDKGAHDAHRGRGTRNPTKNEWRSRIRSIAECKAKLNKDDVVESLVFRMLDKNAVSRITAADVESALG